MEETSVYIPSIDAKDIYLAANGIDCDPLGYRLTQKDGSCHLRKFTNSLDYSLDLIALRNTYYKKFRRKDFSFRENGKHYSAQVINVTFKYSVKEWNQVNKNTYVRLGYRYSALTFTDCIAIDENGVLAGIILGEAIRREHSAVKDSCFAAHETPVCPDTDDNRLTEPQITYLLTKTPKTVKSNAELRNELYQNGFTCEGNQYIRFKRSSGSARVGKCLFIREPLYLSMLKHSIGGIQVKSGQEIDLAAFESYIALPASSIIDTLSLAPENILVIEDYESMFQDTVVSTREENGWLRTAGEKVTITNSIWDGQSLIDVSVLGKYSCYGMVLLRNLMFKSCCFNCNIQKWFRDNNITEVSQLNGCTKATAVSDIKLITTPKSIKYLKFDSLDNWFRHLYPAFGIVKHDKPTPFMAGQMVQTHYQLLNTLQLSQEEIRDFLKPSLLFAQLLRDEPAVVRHYIKYPDIESFHPMQSAIHSKNDVIYHLMAVNDSFIRTKYYKDFMTDLLRAYYKNLKNGHVLVNGNYATLLGNPLEMLQQAIGTFKGISQLGTGNIHSTRFAYDRMLLGTRSPHVTIGNIWLPINRANAAIDSYFNLTPEIVCVNAIDENVLQRLSGADYDSDTVLLTDNNILINAAKRNYERFKTPTSLVAARQAKRYYTPEQQADLDVRTSVNLIGEIINLSQELNSLLWDRLHCGASYKQTEDLYYDICQLDVLSGIEIDRAKKEFNVDTRKELHKIREKYKPALTTDGDKKQMPHFFAHVSKQKGYYNPDKKVYRKYHTSMDYLHTAITSFRIRNPYNKEWLPFTSLLNHKKFRTSDVNLVQINRIYEHMNAYLAARSSIYASELDKEEKAFRTALLKQDLTLAMHTETIGFSTMYQLLAQMEQPEHSRTKNLLLELLFKGSDKSFQNAVLASCTPVKVLEPGGNDIYLFHLPYTITQKQLGSEITGEIPTENQCVF